MPIPLIPGYSLRVGSGLDRALLVKFMRRTYREIYPQQEFSHLAETVNAYLSRETPIWWVDELQGDGPEAVLPDAIAPLVQQPIGCLWVGNGTDQIRGTRYSHILLIYVMAEHRRRGIGSALVRHAEQYARDRGDDRIGLQVFQSNQPALRLYQSMGYASQALWMTKPL